MKRIFRSSPLSFSEAVQKAAPAVINIYNVKQENYDLNTQKIEGLGSGVIVNSNGIILTNYHVIQQATQILVSLNDGRKFTSEIIGYDEMTDLAVLKIATNDLPAIEMELNHETQVGYIVLAIGYPYNIGQTITQGVISATGRVSLSNSRQHLFLQTDAAINRGNSGGALIDSEGRLIGINTAAYQKGDSINLAIPVGLAYKIMMSLIKDGRVTRSSLGISGSELGVHNAESLHIDNPHSFLIDGLKAGSPAAKAGLDILDVITHIDGSRVTNALMLKDRIAETPPAQLVKLTIVRKGVIKTIPVRVAELH